MRAVTSWVAGRDGTVKTAFSRLSASVMSVLGVALIAAALVGMSGASAASGSAVANPTPPAASGWPTNCTESTFLNVTNVTGQPGQTVEVGTYSDETPINTNPYTGTSKNGIVPPNNTYAPQWGVVTNGVWADESASAIGFTAGTKTSPISVTIPTTLTSSSTGWVLVWDSDQNKSGGDCGIASFSITIPAVPSVSVAKSGPSTGSANGTGTYTLVATNSGTGPATNVTVTDSLPVGETFVSSSPSICSAATGGTAVAGTGPGNSQNLTCTIASLAAGTSTSFTVTVRYAADVSGTLTDCATVAGQATPSCAPTVFQGIAGHIALCSAGLPTTTEVPGGTLSATGPQTITSTPNPLAVSGVGSGTYTMSATAPSGYQFSACGGSATIGSPPTTATESVTVPSGGTGTGVFYVVPVSPAPPLVTLSVAKTNDADGSGTYSQTETAPTAGAPVPFRVVVTNTSTVPVTITSLTDSWPQKSPFSPACAAALVGTTLAPGASGQCDFSEPSYAPAAGTSLTDTVSVSGCQQNTANCTSGTATSTVATPPPTAPSSLSLRVTKTNDADGSGTYSQTETAKAVGEDVPFRLSVTNTSSVPIVLTGITDAWPGGTPFSPSCANVLEATALAAGASVTCDFTVANYALATSALTDTATITGCESGVTTNCGSWTATSTVDPPPTVTPAAAPTAAQTTGPATAASSGELAFTGPTAKLQLMLVVGTSLASAGFFLLWLVRPRRRAVEP